MRNLARLAITTALAAAALLVMPTSQAATPSQARMPASADIVRSPQGSSTDATITGILKHCSIRTCLRVTTDGLRVTAGWVTGTGCPYGHFDFTGPNGFWFQTPDFQMCDRVDDWTPWFFTNGGAGDYCVQGWAKHYGLWVHMGGPCIRLG